MRQLATYVILVLSLCLSGQKSNLLPDTILLCMSDTATIEVRQEFGEQARIRWITPTGRTEGTRKIRVFARGMHYVQVNAPSGNTRDSTFVKVLIRPRRLLRDTVFCAGQEIVLDAGNEGMRYSWSSGEKSRRFTVRKEGSYWVRISNGKCVAFDTVKVTMLGVTNPLGAEEQLFCLSETQKFLSARSAKDVSYYWNTGAMTPTLSVTREGTYAVSVAHPRCPLVRDSVRVRFRACECEVMIPNRFTPNEDNRNDHFFPVLSCEYSYYKLTITDRWGNTVFETISPAAKWDGRYKGNLCPEDIYVYRLETTEKLSEKKEAREGTVALLR